MKLRIVAVGSKMPGWVESGYAEYARRMPPELRLELVEIPLAPRRKGETPGRALQLETTAILKAVPERHRMILLDVTGKGWSTAQLAQNLAAWQASGDSLCFVIGGPDGVDATCSDRADECWSLSPLILPHPLVRIVLAEQLYRAWSINASHPYHRG